MKIIPMFKLFSAVSRCTVFTFHLPHHRWVLHREQKSLRESDAMNIPWISHFFFQLITRNLLLANLLKEWCQHSRDNMGICSSPFPPCIHLLIRFAVMCENTLTQMERPLLPRSKWSPCWTVIQDCHPVSRSRLWSSFPSVIRSQACALWKKTATGDWQPTTGFMAVVSGGRQVSRMDDCRRDFTLPSCAVTHTVLPLFCSCWLFFFFWLLLCPCSSGTDTAANNKATVQVNIM